MTSRLLAYSMMVLSLLAGERSLARETPDCAAEQKAVAAAAEGIRASLAAQAANDKIPALTYEVFSANCALLTGEIGAVSAPGSIFRIASISKLFASLATTQLLEQKVFSLDSSLLELDQVRFVKWIKKNESPERRQKWAKIKIRHLLTHQAGISKDVPGALVFFNSESLAQNSYPTMREFYRGLPQVEFLFEPGEVPTGIKYSNLGMNLLAMIVEDTNPAGLTYPEYVAENITKPLGMASTFFDVPEAARARMVQGYGNLLPNNSRTQMPKAFYTGSYQGSIGVATTASDLAKLGRELLRLVAAASSPLLSDRATIRDLFTLKSPAAPTLGWANGFTWQVLPGETAQDPLWLGHTGTGASERAALLTAPEKNLGIVLMFNVTDANREKYAKIVSDALVRNGRMNPEAEGIVASARAFLQRTPAPQNITPAPYADREALRKFEGTYFADVPGYQKVTLTEDGFLSFYGQKLVVEDIASGVFRFPPISGQPGVLFNREPIVFQLDEAGNPVSIRVANVKKFQRVREQSQPLSKP